MSLNRKWHSMDFFGSKEGLNKLDNLHGQRSKDDQHQRHGGQSAISRFRSRLSSISGAKEEHQSPMTARQQQQHSEPPDASVALLVQRCVIIQRDEKGYGFTVTGDNPVFVASVKPDGAAAKAGVQNHDRIVKVNGTLVTSRNHLDVVKLIKSGSYVALTLLGKPQQSTPAPAVAAAANTSIANVPGNRDSLNPGLVTAPQPVNADKDRELVQTKIHMTKTMHETALEDYQKLLRMFSQKPTEKLQTQLMDKERTIKALDNQLLQLTGEPPTTPTYLISKPNRYSDSEHGNFEQFAGQSWQWQHRTSSPSSQQRIKHTKQSSVPAQMGRSGEMSPEMRVGSAAVARSKSDAAVRKGKAASIFYVANQGSDMSEWKSLTPGVSSSGCHQHHHHHLVQHQQHHLELQPNLASSLPSATSDPSSMSDSPQTSPSISPIPSDALARHNGQETDDAMMNSMSRQDIIHDDDEDMSPEDVQVNDPGPFADMKLLENEPAHMAVLLKYLISNIDPSPVLFHIISNAYSKCNASYKELRKWAYEIYSTFIAHGCPLNIGLEDKENLINQIDNILTTSASRTDNETALRSMFQPARASIQGVIAELLADFCNKKDLGMGNFYGFQKLQDNMDKVAASKVAEEILLPFLDSVSPEDASHVSNVNDKDVTTGWAVATFLRLSSGGGSKSNHSPVIERIPTFMMKDKKGIKFPVSRSGRAKNVKSHQFTHQHFYVTTICSKCGYLIWGVGYQGFSCQSCEMAVHKHCVDDVTEVCGGKKKRPSRFPATNARKPSTVSQISVISNQSHGSLTDNSSLGSFVDGGGGGSGGPIIQPIPRDDDGDLAGIPPGHSVMSIVSRYEENSSPTSTSPMTVSTTSSNFEGLEVPTPSPSGTTGSLGNGVRNDRRNSTDLNRSGSLNKKGENQSRPQRRANSDVQMDPETIKAINQSGSSSTSSMSNSPSTSTDNVHEQDELDKDVETELPSLKQTLGEDVLRKLKPKEKKRQEVINELMYTERAHLRNLRVLDKVFNQRMRNDIPLVHELAKALFPNLDEMIKLHETVTKDFNSRREENPVIGNVGEVLLKRFDGENGDAYRKACAEYCRNQVHALEALKKQTRKEIKLAQFLADAEAKPVCRRLHLKDLVPSQMQRLTKYPLLIDNLLKYTHASSEEYKLLERAQERCRHILSYVNHAVKECENYHKLKEIDKKLDRKSLESVHEGGDPALLDFKNSKLADKKLVFDGPLTWKLKQNRTIDLHVLLLEDMLVLLQKQDDKYVLKFQSSNVPMRESMRDENKFTHSPILKLRNLLARDVATDKKSFFVVNISEIRAQMYELIASSSELRIKWRNLINERAEVLKKTEGERPAGSRPVSAVPLRQVDRLGVDTTKLGRQTLMSDPGHDVDSDKRGMDQVDSVMEGIDRLENLKAEEEEEEEEGLVQPGEVCVSNIITSQATAIRTPLELLRHNSDTIIQALEERDRLLAQVLGRDWSLTPSSSTTSTTAAATATSFSSSLSSTSTISLHPTSNIFPSVQTIPELEEIKSSEDYLHHHHENDEDTNIINIKVEEFSHSDENEEKKTDDKFTNKVGNYTDGDQHDDNNNLEQTLLMRAVSKVKDFTLMVMQAQNESIIQLERHKHQENLPKQQQQQQQQQGALDDGSTPPVSPSRRMSGLSQDMAADGTTSSMSDQANPPVSPSPPSLSSKPSEKAKVSMPLDQLKEMMTEMNTIMAKLMGTVNNGKEEKKRLHQELKEAREKLDVLKEMQRQMIITGAVPPDRVTDDDGYSDSSQQQQQQQQQQPSSMSSSSSPMPPISLTLSSPPSSPVSTSSLQQLPPDSAVEISSSSSLLQQQQQQPDSAVDISSSSLLQQQQQLLPDSALEILSTSSLIQQQHHHQAMHHEIQESVVMTESVETLDSAPSTETATVVGHSHRSGSNQGDDGEDPKNKVIEIAMEEDDDDEDNNVSVADLPLPDMASVPPPPREKGDADAGSGVQTGGLLDNVELEESDEDDSETVVGRSDVSHDSVQAVERSDSTKSGEKKDGCGDIINDDTNDDDDEEEYGDAEEGTPVEI